MAEAFQLTAAEHADQVAIRTKDDEFTITWGGYADRVREVAAGMAAMGVGRGDTVGIMMTNRPEFHFIDTAAIHLGATPFSIYNTSTPEQIGYLLEDAGNQVLFTELALLETVLAARDGASTAVELIVVVDGEAGDEAISLAELEQSGGEEFDFEAAWRAVEPDDLLTLIYTSGTTGPPKGVQLTHANLLSGVQLGRSRLPALAPAGGSSPGCRWPTSPSATQPVPADDLRAARPPAARTRARSSPTWSKSGRPGSSRCRGSGRN